MSLQASQAPHHEQIREGRMSQTATLPTRLALLMSALAGCIAHAQEARVADRYPGAALTRHLGDVGELYITTDAVITSRDGEYIALVYHQPYPQGSGDRHTSYALLKRQGRTHAVAASVVASDSGSFTHERPFLYTVDEAELVAFPACFRGCAYTFFRLGENPTLVSVEPYDRLGPGEHFAGRGDVYRFNAEGLVISRMVSRSGDPSCCPSGGTLDISYALVGDTFRISSATRSE